MWERNLERGEEKWERDMRRVRAARMQYVPVYIYELAKNKFNNNKKRQSHDLECAHTCTNTCAIYQMVTKAF